MNRFQPPASKVITKVLDLDYIIAECPKPKILKQYFKEQLCDIEREEQEDFISPILKKSSNKKNSSSTTNLVKENISTINDKMIPHYKEMVIRRKPTI